MKKVFKTVINEDLVSHFKDITMPTLLIWGELDTATPLSDAKIMEKEINKADHERLIDDFIQNIGEQS